MSGDDAASSPVFGRGPVEAWELYLRCGEDWGRSSLQMSWNCERNRPVSYLTVIFLRGSEREGSPGGLPPGKRCLQWPRRRAGWKWQIPGRGPRRWATGQRSISQISLRWKGQSEGRCRRRSPSPARQCRAHYRGVGLRKGLAARQMLMSAAKKWPEEDATPDTLCRPGSEHCWKFCEGDKQPLEVS